MYIYMEKAWYVNNFILRNSTVHAGLIQQKFKSEKEANVK